MSITINNTLTQVNTGYTANTFTPFTVNPGSRRVLFLQYRCSQMAGIPKVNGLNMTQVTGGLGSGWWYFLNPPVGSVIIETNQYFAGSDYYRIGIFCFNDVDQTTPSPDFSIISSPGGTTSTTSMAQRYQQVSTTRDIELYGATFWQNLVSSSSARGYDEAGNPSAPFLVPPLGTSVYSPSAIISQATSGPILVGFSDNSIDLFGVGFDPDNTDQCFGYYNMYSGVTSPTFNVLALPVMAALPLSTINTNAASAIKFNAATLNGLANGNGITNNAWFQYGTASGVYTSTTPTTATGTGSSAYLQNITGLSANQIYYYRAVSDNGQGVVYGAEQSFTTFDTPLVNTNTLPASSINTTGANLNGSFKNGGYTSNAEIQYGTASGVYTQLSPVQVIAGSNTLNNISYNITGQVPGSTVYYRIRHTANGVTYLGSELSVTFALPPVATTTTATAISQNQGTLNGSVNPSGEATTYFFRYGTAPGVYTTNTTTQTIAAGTSPSNVFSSLTGLAPATKYYYVVQATNSRGTVTSNESSFTTYGNPTVATNPANPGYNSAILKGTPSINDVSAQVLFEYGTTSGVYPTSTSSSTITTNNQFQKTILGLLPTTTYFYRAKITNSFGTSYGPELSFTTTATPPLPPTLNNACILPTSITDTGGQVHGTINDNGLASTYHFEYSQSLNGPFISKPTYNVAASSGIINVQETLTNLIPNTLYYYRLVANNIAGTSTSLTCSFYTGASTIISPCVYPRAVITNGIFNGAETKEWSNASDILSKDNKCACIKGTGSMSVGGFNFALNNGNLNLTNLEVNFKATGKKVTMHAFLPDNNYFLIGTQNLTDTLADYTLSTSTLNAFIQDASLLNNLQIVISGEDACIENLCVNTTITDIPENCPVAPEPCCNFPADIPVMTLARHFYKEDRKIYFRNFRFFPRNDGREEKIEDYITTDVFKINNSITNAGYADEETIEWNNPIRDGEIVACDIVKRGIQPYAPYGEDVNYIKEHNEGDAVVASRDGYWISKNLRTFCADQCENGGVCDVTPPASPSVQGMVKIATACQAYSGETVEGAYPLVLTADTVNTKYLGVLSTTGSSPHVLNLPANLSGCGVQDETSFDVLFASDFGTSSQININGTLYPIYQRTGTLVNNNQIKANTVYRLVIKNGIVYLVNPKNGEDIVYKKVITTQIPLNPVASAVDPKRATMNNVASENLPALPPADPGKKWVVDIDVKIGINVLTQDPVTLTPTFEYSDGTNNKTLHGETTAVRLTAVAPATFVAVDAYTAASTIQLNLHEEMFNVGPYISHRLETHWTGGSTIDWTFHYYQVNL